MKKLAFLLIPIFGLFFTSNSFALQYNYDQLLTVDSFYTPPLVRDENNLLYFDFNSTNIADHSAFGSWIRIDLPYSDDYSILPYGTANPYHLSWTADKMEKSGNNCIIHRVGQPLHYMYIYDWIRHRGVTASNSQYNYISIAGRSQFVNGFYPTHNPSVSASYPDSYQCYWYDSGLTYSYDTPSGPFWFERFDSELITNGIRPINPDVLVYNYNGLNLSQSETSVSNGVTYSSSFSFSRLFSNTNIPRVQSLNIPLNDIDGYFLKPENIYNGRQFEWHFRFWFPDGVTFPSDLSTNSFANLRIYGYYRDQNNLNAHEFVSPCTFNTTYLENDNGGQSASLDVTCPVTLETDWAGFEVYLNLGSNSSEPLFSTPGEWYWSGAYLVTDGNYEPGGSFNSDLNGDIWSQYNGNAPQNPDYDHSLSNLFNFTVPATPLGLVFGGFTNQESCASIPILAGMIHSNETEVCPWFSAETRSITTPVLTLFSGFLVFGFIIHWLGSSSGNFLEDSGSHGDGSIKVGKRGK